MRTEADSHAESGTIANTEPEIFVNDIGSDDGSGQVYFNDAASGDDTVGIIGEGSTWNFNAILGQVLITNYWDKLLKINNINVVNTTDENPLVDLNSTTVSLDVYDRPRGGPESGADHQCGRLGHHPERHDQQPHRHAPSSTTTRRQYHGGART